MKLSRTKISVAGYNSEEIAEGLSYFNQYIFEREWLLNPQVEWNGELQLLFVTIDVEGDSPKIDAEGTFDEIWDLTQAAFNFSSDKISFEILESFSIEANP